ncbi:RAD55 family ATPase [Ramlibacter sp.]|uniref:RAD55 family ATPase n=1 Tax=Ramlibacter sp. TaxID=1917967 RepID=UPI003D0C57FB
MATKETSSESDEKRAAANGPVEPHAIARIESQIPRLDYILKGGFFRGGTYTLYGPPGAGKTILANQLCFNHLALTDGKCVYITVLAESHAKMFNHLSTLRFFDPKVVGTRLKYIAAYQTLRKNGLPGVLSLIQATVMSEKPGILIIDGLESIEEAADERVHAKEFLNQLQAFTSMTATTTFLCAVDKGDVSRSDENAMVDGVLELSDHLIGPRAVRELTVHKFRGSGYLRGRHEVEITDAGIQIHPRTEIQFDSPPTHGDERRERMSFGVKGLDDMMRGGVLSGSTVALIGAPGSGKTTLGLSFLVEGAKRGQKGMYFGFYEPPPRLIERAEAMGIPLKEHVDSGAIQLVWQPPLEHYMDSLAESLLERVRGEEPSRRRLFVDGVQGFAAASVYADRLPRFLSALTNQLRAWDVTTLISEELPLFGTELEVSTPELAHVVETVLLLRYVELKSQLHRLISIMKMRESDYDSSIREFKLGAGGLSVNDSFESAEAILSGFPRRVGGMQ